jgi:hypothetical protein
VSTAAPARRGRGKAQPAKPVDETPAADQAEPTPEVAQETTPEPAPETTPEPEPTPDAPAEPANVYEALLAVMREVRAVGKDSRNNDQNFDFRGIDAVMNHVGPAMRKFGLLCLPVRQERHHEQVTYGARNSLGFRTTLTAVYLFMHPSSGTSHEVQVPGESIDSGDKGTTKAMSVAFRTLLIQSLALPTTDRDPDHDVYEDVRPLPDAEKITTELREAVDKAKVNNDPAEIVAWADTYGRPVLAQVVITGKDGQQVSADEAVLRYIEWIKARAAAAAEQDKAAEGETRDVREDAPAQDDAPSGEPAQDARTEDAQPSDEARVTDEARARAEQSAPAQAVKEAEERPSGEARMRAAWQREIQLQADVRGVEPAVYVRGFLAERSAQTTADVPVSLLMGWVKSQRLLVVKMLEEQGNATLAQAWKQVPMNRPAHEQDLAVAENQEAGASA